MTRWPPARTTLGYARQRSDGADRADRRDPRRAQRRAGRRPAASLAFLVLAASEASRRCPLAARRLRACAAAARRLDELCEREPAVVSDPSGARAAAAGRRAEHRERPRSATARPSRPVSTASSLRLGPAVRVALARTQRRRQDTLAHLLVRFRDPDAGTVAIGGTDVRELTQEERPRARPSRPRQDAHLFNTTLRENIRLARPDASDEQPLAGARERRRRRLGAPAARRSRHASARTAAALRRAAPADRAGPRARRRRDAS